MDAKLRSSLMMVICISAIVWSAPATDLARPYDPVIVSGANFPSFLGASISEIFVYSFKNGGWRQIPFQIDEKDGGSYFAVHNGQLDAADELCLMAGDMGDSAADYHWISNYASMAYQRYQICAIDTSVTPHKKAYAYVYRSHTLSTVFTPYMHYVAPTVGSSDTIKSVGYIFAHDNNSIPTHLQIYNGTAFGPDILDRWKIRFEGRLLGVFPFSETEDSALEDTLLYVRAGPVRVIRESVFKLYLDHKPAGKLLSMTMTFYRESARVTLLNEDLPSAMGIRTMRQSVDYDPCVTGAQFHWQKAKNISVDGVDDALGDSTMTVPGVNWFMLQSVYGTVATVVTNDPIANATQYLFYLDDSSRVNGVGRGDTGDQRAFGESGVLVNSNTGYYIETSDENLFAVFYYLGGVHSSALGDTLSSFTAHPLDIRVIARTNEVIPVELASFQAVLQQNGVVLTWQTASETNNYGFQIQRRTSANTLWQIIGFVRGRGTTVERQDYSFVDHHPSVGVNYYRLRQLDADGKVTYSPEVSIQVQAPQSLELEQNMPNPFNPETEIGIRIPDKTGSKVRLTIFNLLGQKVRTLIDQEMPAGYHRLRWDGCDDAGRPMGSGIYLYQLQVGEESRVRKMIKAQ